MSTGIETVTDLPGANGHGHFSVRFDRAEGTFMIFLVHSICRSSPPSYLNGKFQSISGYALTATKNITSLRDTSMIVIRYNAILRVLFLSPFL